jgi:hypothetical protein
MKSLWILPLLAVLAGCNWVNNVSGLSKEAHKALGALVARPVARWKSVSGAIRMPIPRPFIPAGAK